MVVKLGDHKTALIDLRTFNDERGALSVVEEMVDIPFGFPRIYYLHSSSPGSQRGAHAHKQLHQLCIAMAGRIEMETDDGTTRRTYVLDTPEKGLLIRPVVWREVRLQPSSVLMVLASELFSEDDYIWDYDEFIRWIKH
jgi:dTDP-4-dehydrorhamnose 3,5-epimerase-like enzyme